MLCMCVCLNVCMYGMYVFYGMYARMLGMYVSLCVCKSVCVVDYVRYGRCVCYVVLCCVMYACTCACMYVMYVCYVMV